MLLLQLSSNAYAISWSKLTADKHRTLYVDKASVTEQETMRKAWLKIDYKSNQKNRSEPDKQYNLSKVLWYFKCSEQKSATSQVAQYLDDELVYSAGIPATKATFIDPVPETDVDIAMRFVCKYDRKAEKAKIAKIAADKTAKKKAEEEKKKAEEEKKKAEEAKKKADAELLKKAKAEKEAAEAEAHDGDKKDKKKHKSHGSSYFKKHKDKKNATWRYRGRRGPKYWGRISDEYALCGTGVNQSPIDIKKTINADLGEIRSVRKFPAESIENTGKGIEIIFKKGNMMMVDNRPYHLKTMTLRQPSEHTIKGKKLDMEAQFLHQHKNGDTMILSLLYKKGSENAELKNIWAALPTKKKRPQPFEKEITPKQLIPHDDAYYRVNGSLTTPPCTEGVKWVIKKKIQTVSESQLEQLKKIMRKYNVRPVQKLHGRVVLE